MVLQPPASPPGLVLTTTSTHPVNRSQRDPWSPFMSPPLPPPPPPKAKPPTLPTPPILFLIAGAATSAPNPTSIVLGIISYPVLAVGIAIFPDSK